MSLDCEGVSITQRNNSAVLGFASTHRNGWGKYLNGRKKKLSNLIFFKFSPSIRGVKDYIVLNFRGHLAPHFLGGMGQISKLAPLYLRKWGHLGVEIFSSDRGPRGLLIETLGSGHFLTPEFLGNLTNFFDRPNSTPVFCKLVMISVLRLCTPTEGVSYFVTKEKNLGVFIVIFQFSPLKVTLFE